MAKAASNNEILLTPEGKAQLEERLRVLRDVERMKITEEIATARDFGDLRENTQYTQAKERQGEIEDEIQEIEETLRHARIIQDSAKSGTIRIGSTASVRMVSKGGVAVKDALAETFTIVGTMEADPFANRISNESPLGHALLGAKKGDKVSFAAPASEFEYEIISIM